MSNLLLAAIPQLGITVVAFVFLIGVLVIIHEYGHYVMAKRGGVRVDEFSIGFGPLLAHLFDRGETAFNLRALPIGGYVRMAGMEPQDETDDAAPLPPDAYGSKSLGTRASIISAGAIINLVFGFLLIVALGLTFGLPSDKSQVSVAEVLPNTPASRAGLAKGDRILEANGAEVTGMESLHDAVQASANKPLDLVVQRGPSQVHLVATPTRSKEAGKPPVQIGIKMTLDYLWVRHGLADSVAIGWRRSVGLAGSILTTLARRDTYAKRELGGPIAIAQVAGDQAQKGANYFLLFMAIFSINLGVLNLLPLPILDGGHLVLLAIEGIRRRKLSTRFVIAFQSVGFAILFVFFMFIMASDVLRALGRG